MIPMKPTVRNLLCVLLSLSLLLSFAACGKKDAGAEAAVKGGEEPTVPISAEGTLGLLLKKSETQKISQKVNLPDSVAAPVKKGDKVGEIEVYSGDTLIGAIDITARKSVKKMSVGAAFKWLIEGLLSA